MLNTQAAQLGRQAYVFNFTYEEGFLHLLKDLHITSRDLGDCQVVANEATIKVINALLAQFVPMSYVAIQPTMD